MFVFRREYAINPLKPHDASFASLKNDLTYLRKFSWNCFSNNGIFFIFHLPPTLNHLRPLQVESRHVVDDDYNRKFRLDRVRYS